MSAHLSPEIPPKPSGLGFVRGSVLVFLLLAVVSLGVAAIWFPKTLYARMSVIGNHAERAEVTRSQYMSRWDIRMLAYQTGRHYGVEPELVTSVIAVESNYRVAAKSAVGAMGLMQLMPATARIMKVSDPLDPAQNIDGGTRYLKRLLERYKGNKRLALAAYNAGPTAVKKFGGVPPYGETRRYVKRVLALYAQEKERRGVSVKRAEPQEGSYSTQLHGLR